MHLLILFLLHIFRSDPPIVVARDTTYITKPSRPDGLPDYERYMLEMNRQGVTHENNAAVLLWQALWPRHLEPNQYEAMRSELGLKELPATTKFLATSVRRSQQKTY